MIRRRPVVVSPPEYFETMTTSEHSGLKLIEYAKNGDLTAVRRQLLGGCDVNYRCPPDGATALYWAACNGRLTTCDWLVRYGADVNQLVDKSGSLPLHGAADRGHVDCVLLLIGRGSQVDARTKSNNDTALHLAAYRGHLDVCRVLLGHGACAEALNAQGCTALDEARTQNHYEIYQLLWKHRQRHQNYFVRDRPNITSRCSSFAPVQPKRNKLITEVITSSIPADNLSDVTSYNSVSGERIFEITEPSRPQSTKVIEIHSPAISKDHGKDSGKSNVSTPPGECPSNNSKSVLLSNATPLKTLQTHDEDKINRVRINREEEDFDNTGDLVRRLNDLVAYSDQLQIELALRQDENDHLTRENRDLSERLELFKRLSQTIEDVNRAKTDCERRALRAESELELVKRRYETLEMSNRNLENRLRLLPPKDNEERCGCVEISSSRSHRRLVKLDTDELQPRG